MELSLPSAAPERVFRAFTDASSLDAWWPHPAQWDFDAWTDGIWLHSEWRARGKDPSGESWELKGRILEYAPARLLATTWHEWREFSGSRTPSAIRYVFDDCDGGTLLRLQDPMLDQDAWRDRLIHLKSYLES